MNCMTFGTGVIIPDILLLDIRLAVSPYLNS